MKPDWRSYDAIADGYARVAEACFTGPARDLVSMLELAPGARFLDVGSGTGVVAALAAERVGPSGVVVALDRSIGMLRHLPRHGGAHAVAAALPKLPHPESSFDAIAAAFVLTHVADLTGSLQAMARALQPGGRLAIASWAQTESSSAPGRDWHAVLREFVADEGLRAAIKTVLPWEEKFSSPAFHETALSSAGLLPAGASERTYSMEMPTRTFVELRLISSSGRFARSALSPAKWAQLQDESYRRLLTEHGTTVTFDLRANFAVGRNPADSSYRGQTPIFSLGV